MGELVMLGYGGIVVMLILCVIGMPMAYAMCTVASIGLCFTLGPVNAATQTMLIAWEQGSNFSLMSVPLFIFMGTIAYRTEIVSDLFDANQKWIGFMPGGLAAAGVLAAAAFGAVTGSTAAASATMASTVIPELEKYKYDMELSSGAVAASGGLAAVIPPSVFLIIFAVLTDQSIGELFIASFTPGIMITFLFTAYIMVRCAITPALGPRGPRYTWGDRFRCLPAALPIIIVFMIVLGGIYCGIATPTEAAVMGVIGVLLIAGCMGRLTKCRVVPAFVEGTKLSAAIFFLFIGGWLMARFLITTGATHHLVNMFVGMELSYYGLIFMMFILFLILGCILESTSILILTMPFMFPITQQYGIDPIWFGVFVTTMMVLAGISPPVGLNVFIVHGICPNISVNQIYRGSFPFLVMLIISIILMTIFPEVVTYLPKLMMSSS